MSPNEHLVDFLDYYTALDDPQYAVLLDGSWGSGKTWFIKNYIENHTKNPENFLYVSLYGVHTFDDLEADLYAQLNPFLGSKTVRFGRVLLRGALKATLKFDLFGDDKPDIDVAATIPTDRIQKLALEAKHVLVLDDLERSELSITQILGYVNQFVEHAQLHAILLAHEAVLLEGPPEDNPYRRIKEKLIGRSFQIKPETDAAIHGFAAALPSLFTREAVKKSLSAVVQVFEASGYSNLRMVRHVLSDFDRLCGPIDQKARAIEPLVADLLKLFLAYSLEVRSGNLPVANIKAFRVSVYAIMTRGQQENDPDEKWYMLRSKYDALDLNEDLVTAETWTEIFKSGTFPAGDINQSLLRSNYLLHENQPEWVKLWHGIDLEDDRFDSVLAEVVARWDKKSFDELGVVLHVAGMLLQHAKQGILPRSAADVSESARSYVDHLLEQGSVKLPDPDYMRSPFERDSFGGLGFHSGQDPDFRALLDYVEAATERAVIAHRPTEAAELLKVMRDDVDAFVRHLIVTNSGVNRFARTPILHLIAADDFVATLVALPASNWRKIHSTFKLRYDSAYGNAKLRAEATWLRTVAQLLEAEVSKRQGKISSQSLGAVLLQIQTVAASFDPPKPTRSDRAEDSASSDCAGQVFSDTAIGCLIADCCSKALGGKLPSLECSRTLL